MVATLELQTCKHVQSHSQPTTMLNSAQPETQRLLDFGEIFSGVRLVHFKAGNIINVDHPMLFQVVNGNINFKTAKGTQTQYEGQTFGEMSFFNSGVTIVVNTNCSIYVLDSYFVNTLFFNEHFLAHSTLYRHICCVLATKLSGRVLHVSPKKEKAEKKQEGKDTPEKKQSEDGTKQNGSAKRSKKTKRDDSSSSS